MKSRQKSCEQCANSKRQCDRVGPKCSRCSSKGLRCLYKSAPSDSADMQGEAPVTLSNDDLIGAIPAMDAMFLDHSDFQPVPMSLPALDVADSNNSLTVDDHFFAEFDNFLASNTPLPHQIGVMDRSRIRFLVRQLKTYPSSMVQRGRAPFIHPQAYYPLMPQSLQDVVSASALYLSKNEQNETMVWEIFSAKVAQLIEPRGSWSVSEHLSCLQALIIYQIIRLFDGDIRQRADAEKNEDILVDWTERLVLRTGVNIASDSVIPNSWEHWVFEEVVRRTIIVSRMVQSMFMIQKQGYCTMVEAVTEMSFTGQRALWEAPTAMHWFQAGKKSRRFYFNKMDFGELMEKGTLGEVDELGLLMLVCYKGVDGVNEWIVRKGGNALIE